MPNILETFGMLRKSVTNKSQSDDSTALPMGGADSTFGTSNHQSSKATAATRGGGLFRKPTRREIHETHKRNMIALLLSVTTFCLLAIFGLSKTLFRSNDDVIVDSGVLNHAHVGAFSQNDMSEISARIREQQKEKVINMNLDGLGHFHNRPVPVNKFPFLKSVLDGADLVGLYFAASWCPMSTPVTSMLSGDMMPEAISAATNALETVGAKSGKSLIDIVYVSSDETAEQMDAYIDSEWTNWKSVPFDSDERTELKRYFKTCALREVESLNINRKHEIPTLIIIDGSTKSVLTYEGVKDVEAASSSAYVKWLSLSATRRMDIPKIE